MKRLPTILICAVSLSATLPAFAGPDWKAIEQARKDHRAQVGRMEKLTPDEKCTERLVLPLNHGPRAQSTPYLNEKRKASFEAGLKACNDAAAIGNVQ